MMKLAMPAEAIDLIKSLLETSSPITFAADSMDHGQGAEITLTSDVHSERLASSAFDLTYWLFDKCFELRDETVSYWAGDGRLTIYEKAGELQLDLALGRGYYSECDSPIEQLLLHGFSERVYERARAMSPESEIDELSFSLDLDFSYCSGQGVGRRQAAVRTDAIDGDTSLSTKTLTALAETVLVDCEQASEVFNGQIPEGVELSVSISCSNFYLEDLQAGHGVSYETASTFQLQAQDAHEAR